LSTGVSQHNRGESSKVVSTNYEADKKLGHYLFSTPNKMLLGCKYIKRNKLILRYASLAIIFFLLFVSQQLTFTSDNIETSRTSRSTLFASNEALPRISFEKTVYDLGDVGRGTKNTCEFRFTNTGRGLLKIGKISRTCGCTVFHLGKKQYPPNETGVIKVIYTATKSTKFSIHFVFSVADKSVR
jgi:hypothetical protein